MSKPIKLPGGTLLQERDEGGYTVLNPLPHQFEGQDNSGVIARENLILALVAIVTVVILACPVVLVVWGCANGMCR